MLVSDVDLVVRQGLVHDGSGGDPWVADVAIHGDRIVAVADQFPGRGDTELDAADCVVAPGFINMMSWAVETLIEDGRSMSDVMQGVTLEVMGEGASMGPLNEQMRAHLRRDGLEGVAGGYRYPVPWTTLCEYLTWLADRGVSPNIASFVGAGTLRVHQADYADRPLRPRELSGMCELLDDEMRHGALGVASALIYPPETAYLTEELVALARISAAHGGMYASHIRSESAGLTEAVAEVIDIARQSSVRAEIYHLKAAGRAHWPSLPSAIALIEQARAEGLALTADVYPYEYSGTSLSACIPPWAHDGGPVALRARLRDEQQRQRIKDDMALDTWENPFRDAGPQRIQVRGPLNPDLSHLCGLTLAEIAQQRHVPPETVAMDLVRDHAGDIFALYFEMNGDDVRRIARQPWVSFCSDAESLASETADQRGAVHPRAFGAFAKVLSQFVRKEQVLTLSQAIRQLTSLPAANLGLTDRGRIAVGYHADIAIFDADEIADHATPEKPAVYASGMVHVLVNGVPVVRDGVHTGARPGRFVRGPGAQTS